MAPGKDVGLSSDREALKAEFLRSAGLDGARREVMGGDASTRLYERLHRGDGTSLIFMDQPPAVESSVCPPDATPAERLKLGYNAAARLAAGSVAAFVTTAGFLRGHGLSAPLIEGGQDERPLYEAAVDAQVAMQADPPPEVIRAGEVTWPLLTYDTLALKVATDTFLEWWPKLAEMPAFGAEAVAEWDALWAPVWVMGEAGASVFT